MLAEEQLHVRHHLVEVGWTLEVEMRELRQFAVNEGALSALSWTNDFNAICTAWGVAEIQSSRRWRMAYAMSSAVLCSFSFSSTRER